MSKTEVLIVGGGPAGSAAAIYCANHNLSVTLLESERFPRMRPGETLHPGVDIIFRQLGVYNEIQKKGFIRHEGISVKWTYNDPPKISHYGKDKNGRWLGYQAFRPELDNILLSKAKELGVRVIQPTRVLEVLSESGRLIGAKSSSGKEILADFVIDAGGAGHWLAKSLSLTVKRYSIPLYVQYGYAHGKCPIRNQVPLFEATPWGWIWLAKIKHELYQWTILNFHGILVPYNWLPDEFKGLVSSQAVRGADVTWRRVIQPSGTGYFIIGDAATVLDPSSSHGVLKGLMSGIQAAQAILRITKENFSSVIASLRYNEWISQWFFQDVRKLKEFYIQHPGQPIKIWTDSN